MRKNGYEFYATQLSGRPVTNGLVDYVLDGYLLRDGHKIPCEIGYTNVSDDPFVIGLDYVKTHIFIKKCVLDDGYEVEAETITLDVFED